MHISRRKKTLGKGLEFTSDEKCLIVLGILKSEKWRLEHASSNKNFPVKEEFVLYEFKGYALYLAFMVKLN